MYKIKKTLEIAGCHKLNLPYESKCQNLHGHNWIITVYCKNKTLMNDMVIDFIDIKNAIHDKLDHKDFNKIFDFNPTAERIAKWICTCVPHCYKVDVQESQKNIVTYEI